MSRDRHVGDQHRAESHDVELSLDELRAITAFVEKLRADPNATDNFVQSVVTSCMSYGHSRDAATPRRRPARSP